jgi:hypothetical protein
MKKCKHTWKESFGFIGALQDTLVHVRGCPSCKRFEYWEEILQSWMELKGPITMAGGEDRKKVR